MSHMRQERPSTKALHHVRLTPTKRTSARTLVTAERCQTRTSGNRPVSRRNDLAHRRRELASGQAPALSSRSVIGCFENDGTRDREVPMTSKRGKASIGIIAFVACAFAAQAQQAPDPRVADLIQSGKLRIALGLGSPVLAIKDPKSGEVRGPALDLARVLAASYLRSSVQLAGRGASDTGPWRRNRVLGVLSQNSGVEIAVPTQELPGKRPGSR
jgi:hypothetical protein